MASAPQTDRATDLPSALRALQAALDEHDAAQASRLGLARNDWRCLHMLVSAGASSPSAIQRALGLTSGSVTALLDRLERRELITRQRNRDDRRALLIVAQASAHAMIDEAQARLYGLLAKVEKRLGPDRALRDAQLIGGLAKLVERASNPRRTDTASAG
ncbi:MAG: MarR family transcriptional regulator [Pseudomonadota bacterium]